MWLSCCLIVLFLVLPVLWWIIFKCQRNLPVQAGARCLLVIAHPDDETMFFGPTIRRLVQAGVHIFVLSVTCGNADGLGSVRKRELAAAVQCLGIPLDNLTILDMEDYPDGPGRWEIEKLARIVLQYIEKLDCNLAISFDAGGVSGHRNHISCFQALQFLYTNGRLPPDVMVFSLETVWLARKYSGLLDLVPSLFKSTYLNIASLSDVRQILLSMCRHRSQLVWFRYLYLLFSRYIVINSLKRIPMHPYCAKSR